MSDKLLCEHCKGEFDELLTVTKNRRRTGEDYWVCTDCFIELEGIGFEDYRLETIFEVEEVVRPTPDREGTTEGSDHGN